MQNYSSGIVVSGATPGPKRRWVLLGGGIGLVLLLVIAGILLLKHNSRPPANVTPSTATSTKNSSTLKPDTNPSVSITAIDVSAKQTSAQVYTLTANVTATIGIQKVEFYANNKLVGSAAKSPYTLPLSAAALPDGKVSIVAKAYDVNGGTKTSNAIEVTITHSAAQNTTKTSTQTTAPTTANPDTGTGGGSSSGGTTTTPYVQPGSQGYKGSTASLTLYTEANGLVPPGQNCAWDHTYKNLECRNTDLTLDHVYIKGGIYWDGCGNLTISNSIIDWKPSKNWHNIHAACDNSNPGATLTITNSTLRPSDDGTPYTGSIDIGGVDVGNLNTGSPRPMLVSNSLLQGFPQGLDPAGGSIIKYNEIYTADVWCTNSAEWCHTDGLFSQGGNNLTYQGNYVTAPTDPVTGTAAIFFQSSGRTTGHKIIDNYIKGGAYTFYNQSADNITVENNTFGAGKYGYVSNIGTITSWLNNKQENGTVIPKP